MCISWNNWVRAQEKAFRPNIIQVINYHHSSVLKRNQEIGWRILNCVCNSTDNEEVHPEKTSGEIKQHLLAGRGTSPKRLWMSGHAARLTHTETSGRIREWKYGKRERKQHFVLFAADFKEATACVSAERVWGCKACVNESPLALKEFKLLPLLSEPPLTIILNTIKYAGKEDGAQ